MTYMELTSEYQRLKDILLKSSNPSKQIEYEQLTNIRAKISAMLSEIRVKGDGRAGNYKPITKKVKK